MVENLISDSLRNFSSRLGELDVAVKTPLDLLSKSNALAQKHRDLENKVVHMEIEVLNLEEKYKHLVCAFVFIRMLEYISIQAPTYIRKKHTNTLTHAL